MESYERTVAELIDKYVYAVVKRLPQQQRADIEKELRSLIDDMLADRTGGSPAALKDAEVVLKELGRPSAMAAKYRGTTLHLIGPDFFDLYFFVMKIVVIVAAAATALAQVIALAVEPPSDVAESFGMFVAGIIQAGMQSFAVITIVFAIIERVASKKGDKMKTPEWKPSDLPPVPVEKARIKRADPIVSIIFTVAAIVIFNTAPWLFGATDLSGRTFIPVFNLDVLYAMMPFINIIFGLSLLKDTVKLIVGQYDCKLAVIITVINIAALVSYLYVFAPAAIWNMEFMASINAAFGFEWAGTAEATHVWGIVIKVLIGLTVFGYVADTIKSIARALRHKER